MRRRRGQFYLVGTMLLVVISLTASPVADLRASAAAMACCAKTDYTCAGLSGPDDCCRHMGHAAHGVTAGMVSSDRLIVTAVPLDLAFNAETPTLTTAPLDLASAFTRPHDPPHLHPYGLLI